MSDKAMVRYREDGSPVVNVARDATFEDVIAALGESAVDVSERYGDGFDELPDMRTLVKRDFVIIDARFTPGVGGEKVTCRVVTADGHRYYFNNGSPTGVYGQLRLIAGPAVTGVVGVRCRKGLRISEFHYDAKSKRIVDGLPPNTATFYLADGPQVESETA